MMHKTTIYTCRWSYASNFTWRQTFSHIHTMKLNKLIPKKKTNKQSDFCYTHAKTPIMKLPALCHERQLITNHHLEGGVNEIGYEHRAT